MLKRISLADVGVGMYVHKVECSWLDTPFWRPCFLVSDGKTLSRLRSTGVDAVWIDLDKGADMGIQSVQEPLQRSQSTDSMSARLPELSATAERPATDLSKNVEIAQHLLDQSELVLREIFSDARLGKTLQTASCRALVAEISALGGDSPGALISLSRLKHRDNYTHQHCMSVCAMMVALGKTMGLDESACRSAGLAGLLHDIGKTGVSIEVLNKPGKLTDEEFANVKTHPLLGHAILADSGVEDAIVLDVCLHHHERMDGSGYPHRRPAESIDLFARMAAVCDVYDAVTSERPYKAGWDPAEAMAKMCAWTDHLDQRIVEHFIQTLGIYPVGSLVRLASNKLAVVLEHNPQRLLAPKVCVFFSTLSNEPIPVKRLDLSMTVSDCIVSREPMERGTFPHLESMWAGAAAKRRLAAA